MNVKTNVGKTFFKLLQKHFPSNHPMNHPTIKFSIAKRVKGNTFINNCNLCLSEKVFIIRNLNDVNMLNKTSEFISKCRHINKRLLNRVKDDSND